MKEVSFFPFSSPIEEIGYSVQNFKTVKIAKFVVSAVFGVLIRFGFTQVQMTALRSPLILPPHEYTFKHPACRQGHKILKNNGFASFLVIAWFDLVLVFALVKIIHVVAKIVQKTQHTCQMNLTWMTYHHDGKTVRHIHRQTHHFFTHIYGKMPQYCCKFKLNKEHGKVINHKIYHRQL